MQESKSVCACVCVSDMGRLLIVTLPWTWFLSNQFFSDAIVGFANTLYNVLETSGYVQVCVNVKQPRGSCPIQHPYSVNLYTLDGTAGTNTL